MGDMLLIGMDNVGGLVSVMNWMLSDIGVKSRLNGEEIWITVLDEQDEGS